MKKLFLLVLCACVAFACAKKSEVEDLQKQIDELKSGQIASLNAQVAGITLSIGNLQSVDTELRGYIQTLQQQKEELEQADRNIDQAIKDLKTELSGDISTAEANALAQLEAYKSTVAGQIAGINQSITALENKDANLQQQITALRNYIDNDLKTYIDNGDQSVKTWASATFVTLDQFNTTAGIVAEIQGQITTINQQITQLGNTIAGVSPEELSQAINGLDASLQEKIRQSVADCGIAIDNAKQEITSAYTTAIRNAISDSESSMKTWVNSQLGGYYTIAQTDAKLTSLRTTLEGQLNGQKTYLEGLLTSLENTLNQKISQNASDIEDCRGLIAECNRLIAENAQAISDNAAAIVQLRTDLNTARTEITAAYQQAITTAINTLDGQLRGKIADEVSTLNGRIDNEVETINNTITELTGRVATCERDIRNIKNTIYGIQQDIEDIQEQIADILARIQSIAYVPKYSDGKAVMTYTDNGTLIPGTMSLDFKLQPAATAAELVGVWQTALTLEAVYTITKAAPERVVLTITSVTAEDGYLSVTVSGAGLREDFFRSRCGANATLIISDGNNELTTDYIQVIPWTTDVISFGDDAFKAYCVANFDTSGDGEISEDEAKAVTAINASMLNISSLVGIEYFSNLETLDVSFNKLTTLDLTHSPLLKTIDVSGNKLQNLNLGGLAELETLEASSNKLGTLDVSESPVMVSLNCSNNELGTLNLAKNKALKNLQCNSNHLQQLNLKNNVLLETLYCRRNEISVLDVTKLTKLKEFDCSQNSLTAINVYQNPDLEIFYCASNQLTSLGIGANTKLTFLDCHANAITSLDVSGNALLEELNCASNQLIRLDISKNPGLTTITCTGNPNLAKLWVKDTGQAAGLTLSKDDFTMIAYNNGGINIPDANLKAYLLALFDDDEDGEISILEAENVQSVNTSGRSISSLEGLELCPNLKYLNFANNNVTVADLPNLQKLETVVAYGNALTRLNLNNDVALKSLYIIDVNTNAISSTTLSIDGYAQAAALKLSIANTPYTSLKITNSTVLTSIDVTDNTQLTELVVSGNPSITALDVSTLEALTTLVVNANGLTALDVSRNVALVTFDCSSNALTALNVDNNMALVTLDCSDNQLASLRVSNNTLLETIDASDNHLVNLNVRQNTSLISLNVSSNSQITALDLHNNLTISKLFVNHTGLAELDLRYCLDLNYVELLGDNSLINVMCFTDFSAPAVEIWVDKRFNFIYPDNSTIHFIMGSIYVDSSNNPGVITFVSQDGDSAKILSIKRKEEVWCSDQSYYYKRVSQLTNLPYQVGASVSGPLKLTSKSGMENTNSVRDKISSFPAFSWCICFGEEWYLPSIEELKEAATPAIVEIVSRYSSFSCISSSTGSYLCTSTSYGYQGGSLYGYSHCYLQVLYIKEDGSQALYTINSDTKTYPVRAMREII